MSLVLTRKLGFHTLFMKLLLGFLAVILLLAAFNLVSFFYLKKQIHNEIVKYNELGINHAVDSYENQFRLTREMVLGLNQNPMWTTHVNLLRHAKDNNAYGYVNNVMEDMKRLYSNPFLYFDNLIIYFQDDAYVIEKDGTSSAKAMFGTYYNSHAYPLAFWNEQFDQSYAFQVFPTASFAEKTPGSAHSKGMLMPIVIKIMPYRDVYFIVLLDAERLSSSLHVPISGSFYILGPDGQPLYQSTPESDDDMLAILKPDTSYMETRDYYYFYKKGPDTGFTYVSRVPVQSISSQLLNLNLILLSLLAVVGILIILTFLFSKRVHKPIRQMVDILKGDEPEVEAEPVREFELISRRVHHMRTAHQRISRDLARKNSILRHYAYTNRLKNIHMNVSELKELADANMPYMMIVYEIVFKDNFGQFQLAREKGAYYIREYIDHLWQQLFPDSVTIQTETHQVLTIVFVPGEMPELNLHLLHLKDIFDVDHDHYLITMASSPLQPAGSAFTTAYEQVTEMLVQRRLLDETQWIHPSDPTGIQDARYFKMMWEQEFQTRLMSGSEESMEEWIHRSLNQLAKKNAVACDYRQFAKDIVNELDKSLRQLNLTAPYDALPVPSLEQTKHFYSPGQYEVWLRSLLNPALQLIRRKTENHDPITSFVIEYIQGHLEEDINLDMMADKLNITSGYLSTYFKEKTGMNFSDYLNDVRIRSAKELLHNLELRIQDVAAKVGYQNVNSFIRMFKRHAGITPGEYRKRAAS